MQMRECVGCEAIIRNDCALVKPSRAHCQIVESEQIWYNDDLSDIRPRYNLQC